jgi:hypothetical protein
MNGTLTINPATPTVNVTCPAATYDGSAHVCTAVATGIGGVTVSGTFTFAYGGSATAPAAAGTYAVSASFTSGDPSYSNAAGAGTLTVNPAVLTVTANNQSMIFGGPVPAFTYTPSGFVGADTATVLTGSPQLSTTAISASPTGSYPIIVTAGTLEAANYTFSFVNGTLTIAPATPIVIVTCLAVTYDGAAHGCTAAATGVGGVLVSGAFTSTYNGHSAEPINAGTYAFSTAFVSSDPNYVNATGTGVLVITKATPVVTVSCPSVDFDFRRHACTATVAGVPGMEVFGLLIVTFDGRLIPPFEVGTYAVVAKFFSLDPNYTNATGTGTLTIARIDHDHDDGD